MRHFFFFLFLLPAILVAQKTGTPNENARPSEANTYEKVGFQLPEKYEVSDVKAYLLAHYPFLVQEKFQLELSQDKTSKGGRHLAFELRYLLGQTALPIYQLGLKANVNRQGKIISLLNQVEKAKNIQQTQFLPYTAEEEAKLVTTFSTKYQAYQTEIHQVLYLKENTLYSAYQVITFAHQFPFSMEIIISNDGNTIFESFDRAAYHGHHQAAFVGDTTGKGYVFLPDPRTGSHQNYGVVVSDNNDQHLPIFDDFTYELDLKDITYDTNAALFRLDGPYVKIEDIDPTVAIPVTTTDGNFFYTRDANGFEDVMAYFHIDSCQRYIQSLGFNNMYNAPLRVDPHGWGNSDNSHFIANGANSYLGFGEGGVDDAEDLDVLVHEYGHALSYSVATNTNTGTERKGLDEGFGDYLAASRSYDMDTFFWAQTYTWDGHNQYWGGRNAASTVVYPPTVNLYGNWIYAFGDIWASTLMRIRFAVGDTTGDILALQEMFGNFSNMTMRDAAQIYLDADSTLYGGAHSEIIRKKFCEVSLMIGNDCIFVGNQPQILEIQWNLYPNPNNGQFRLALPNTSADYNLSLLNAQGQIVWQKKVQSMETIQTALPQGVYYAQLVENGKVVGRKKVVVW
ncbi:MAG: T9SS type A sorting domain-containing protein [Bacteroidia bacterium]